MTLLLLFEQLLLLYLLGTLRGRPEQWIALCRLVVFRALVNEGGIVASFSGCLLGLLDSCHLSPLGFTTVLGEMSCYPTVIAVSFCRLGSAGSVSLVLSLSLASIPLGAAQIHWYGLVVVGSGSGGRVV